MPTRHIVFRYLPLEDIVVATPHWDVETPADAETWFGQYESYLGKFCRRMDLILVLDDFRIAPQVGVIWGEHRARMQRMFTRFSVRVNANCRVKLFVDTSGVRHDVSAEQAASVAEAIERIREARRRLLVEERNAGRFAASPARPLRS